MHTSMQTHRHYLLIAGLIACMLTGCGDPIRAKIVGTWTIEQADNVMSRISRPDSEAVDSPIGNGRDSPPPKMLISFLKSGRLETSTHMGEVNQEKQGQWKLISFNETTNAMRLLCDIQDQETEHEIEFLDPDTIKLVPPNMAGTTMKIRFKRQH